MNNNPYPTIIANIRFAKDTDKFLVNRDFADWEVAQAFCDAVIGDYSEDYGTVEFILLTDYTTMNSQEYSLESNESLGRHWV